MGVFRDNSAEGQVLMKNFINSALIPPINTGNIGICKRFDVSCGHQKTVRQRDGVSCRPSKRRNPRGLCCCGQTKWQNAPIEQLRHGEFNRVPKCDLSLAFRQAFRQAFNAKAKLGNFDRRNKQPLHRLFVKPPDCIGMRLCARRLGNNVCIQNDHS